MTAFHASECLVGPLGTLLVGSREPGTRVVRRTARGFFELAFPFEPTRHRPVTWLDGGAFRIVGRNGEELVVDDDGRASKPRAITGKTVLAGVEGRVAVAIGPRFFEEGGAGAFHDVTPEEGGDPLDFRSLIGRTKLVLAIAGGPMPAVFVDGAVFRRGPGKKGWRERALDGRRVLAATATPKGTIYAATTTGALLRLRGDAVDALPLPLSGARVHALAVGCFGLLVASSTGLFEWTAEKTRGVPVPGEGPVTDVSAWGDVEVAVRAGRAWSRRRLRRSFGEWEPITVPS